jgi:hypothetical protein
MRLSFDDRGVVAFVAVLAVAAAAVVFFALSRKVPDTALVIATEQDCLRAFDKATCDDIVTAAMTVHGRTAPRFFDAELCELSYGAGGCRAVQDGMVPSRSFAPKIAVILAPRDGDLRELVPLYFAPGEEGGVGPRRVFYRGSAIGTLSQDVFAGAQLSRVAGKDGKPLTSGAVRKLRQG